MLLLSGDCEAEAAVLAGLLAVLFAAVRLRTAVAVEELSEALSAVYTHAVQHTSRGN